MGKLAKMVLPSGLRGFTNDAGQWVCTGADMGRRSTLPDNRNASGKLRLVRLRWVDGDYDAGGAYWGGTGRDSIYWAKGDLEGEEFTTELFERASSRAAAKAQIRKQLPNVTFYR